MDDGEYIGTSSFCRSRFEQYPESGEVISIYFRPEYIRKGYGNKLMDFALGELRKAGFKDAFLWVLEENYCVRSFYEAMGFSKTDDFLDDSIGGRDLREIRYIISL